MSEETDVAVAKNDIAHIKESLASIKDIAIATRNQATKTNGRVNRMEERHTQEDKQGFPERLRMLERIGYSAMTLGTVILVVGATWFNSSVKEVVRDELSAHVESVETKIQSMIDDALEDYVFEIIEE